MREDTRRPILLLAAIVLLLGQAAAVQPLVYNYPDVAAAGGEDLESVAADAFIYFNGALGAGSDLWNLYGVDTYQQARDKCLQSDDCVGFTFSGDDKTSKVPQPVYYKSGGISINGDPNWNAYLRRPGMDNCTAIDGMDFTNGWGTQKTVFQQTTADQCCSYCAAFRTACQAWIWDKSDHTCTIDNWNGDTKAGIAEDSGKISGWGPGTDCVTVGIQQCNVDPACLAFSMGTVDGKKYEVELYTCTVGQSYTSGWTVYRKKDNFAIPFDNTRGDQNQCLIKPLMARFTCSQGLVNEGQYVSLATCDPNKARQKWSVEAGSKASSDVDELDHYHRRLTADEGTHTLVPAHTIAFMINRDTLACAYTMQCCVHYAVLTHPPCFHRTDHALPDHVIEVEIDVDPLAEVGVAASAARPPCDIGGAWAASAGATYEIEMSSSASFRMLSLSPTSWLTAVGTYTMDPISEQPMASVTFDDGRTEVGFVTVSKTTLGHAVCSYIDWGPKKEGGGQFRYAWALPCNSTDPATAAVQDGWRLKYLTIGGKSFYEVIFTDNSNPDKPFVGCLDRSSVGRYARPPVHFMLYTVRHALNTHLNTLWHCILHTTGFNKDQVTVAPCTNQMGQRWLMKYTTMKGGPAESFVLTAADDPTNCLDLFAYNGPAVDMYRCKGAPFRPSRRLADLNWTKVAQAPEHVQQACVLPSGRRQDCGWDERGKAGCLARGCCFDDKNGGDWCSYYTPAPVCNATTFTQNLNGMQVLGLNNPKPTCDESNFLSDIDFHGDGQGLANEPGTSAGDCCSKCATKYAQVGCNYFTLAAGVCWFFKDNAGARPLKGAISGGIGPRVNTTTACIQACCDLGRDCEIWQFCDAKCAALAFGGGVVGPNTCWIGGIGEPDSIVKDETTVFWQGGGYSADNQLFQLTNCQNPGTASQKCTLKSLHWGGSTTKGTTGLCIQAKPGAPANWQPDVPVL
jgi:hypothetical protein